MTFELSWIDTRLKLPNVKEPLKKRPTSPDGYFMRSSLITTAA